MPAQFTQQESALGEASPSRRRFSAHVAGTFAARILMAVNSVVAGVIVARWLGAAALGALAVLNVSISYAVQIGSLGIALANTYYIAQDRRHLAPAATNALIFGATGGACLAFLIILVARVSPQIFGDVPLNLVAFAAVSIPFQLITLIGLNIFLATGSIARFNLLDALGQTLLVINAFLALVIFGGGLSELIKLNAAASVCVSLLIMWLVRRYISGQKERGRWRADGALFVSMMRYGLKLHAQTVASLLLFRVDLLIVKYFRGATEAGVYSVASQVALMLMLLPAVISTLLFPRVAAARDARGTLAARTTRHTAFVMLGICLAAAPALYALPLLYGATFRAATIQALILLPGVLAVSVGGVLAQHFSGTNLPVALPLFWVATLLFNTALNFSLVPLYGARGAAISSSISYALIFSLIALYFRSQTGSTFRQMFVISKAELRELVSTKHFRIFSLRGES